MEYGINQLLADIDTIFDESLNVWLDFFNQPHSLGTQEQSYGSNLLYV